MRFRMMYWRLFRRPRLVTSRLSGPRPPAMSARAASRDTSGPAMFAVFLATRLLARRRGRGRPRGTDPMMSSPRPPDDPSRKPSP
jgi:hypothetical protein